MPNQPTIGAAGALASSGHVQAYSTASATLTITSAGSLTINGFFDSGSNSISVVPKGQTTVTWRAIDGTGRSSTCSFTVTVGGGAAGEQGGVSREPLALGVASETSGAKLQTLNFNLWPNPAVSEVQISVESFGSEALVSRFSKT